MVSVQTLEMQLLVDPSWGQDLCQMSSEIILATVTGGLDLWSMVAPAMWSRAHVRRGAKWW